MRAHDDFVIVTRRSFVTASRINYGDKATVVSLHFAIRKPESPHQLHAADFKPDKIVRVIDHTHLVGLRIAHTKPHLVRVPAHLPLQRGLRFSRNEVTPSRKSSV